MVAPVIIIPGLSGSVLVNVKHPQKKMFNKTIVDNRWLNIHPYSPNYMKRWKNDMKCELEYAHGHITGYKNMNPDIQPYDLFGLEGIQNIVGDFEILSKSHQDVFHSIFNYRYFYDLNHTLLKHGHRVGDTLFGFPWDFRFILDPGVRKRMFHQLYCKIQEIVHLKKRRVNIVCHSLGGVLIKWFLEEYVSEDWCSEHIGHLVLVNVPFGGTPSAVKALFVGDYFIPYFNQFFVEELRVNSGIIMGLPNTLCYTHRDTYWISDNTKKPVTIASYQEDKHNIAFNIWNDLYKKHLTYIGKVNMIPVTFFNSCNIETPSSFWSKSNTEAAYKIVHEDGDGIIPTRSLNVGLDLFPNHKVFMLPKTNHAQSISHEKFLEYVRKLT